MNNQLVMKELKVNPMHDSPFYSSLAFPISTIVGAIILSTADTVLFSMCVGSTAQSTHADYLSGLPGDPPWIIMYARPLSLEAVFLVLQESTNSVVGIMVTRGSGYYVGTMKKCTEDLVQTHMSTNYRCTFIS